MTDLELLFLVLAVIYLWECACWLRRGSVVFMTWFGRRWRLAHPAGLLGNQRGGFVVATPLPPLGTMFVGNQFPLSLSPEAMLAYVATTLNPGNRPEQTAKLFRFEEVHSIEVRGKKLLVNEELLLKTATPTLTEYLAQQLRQLTKVPAAKRADAIEQLIRDAFHTKAIERRWQDFQKQARDLRLVTNFLFGYLFIFAPALIWKIGFRQCWAALLIGLLGFTITTALLFRRDHKKFYPDAEDERFTHFVTILLSPATTIRAHDILSRPLLENFHPLAIAKVFCAEEQFRHFARKVLRDIRHPALPICPREDTLGQITERNSRARLQQAVEKFLKKNGVAPEELTRPPSPADQTCRSYCPRCEAQFTMSEGACADCGGVPLMKLE